MINFKKITIPAQTAEHENTNRKKRHSTVGGLSMIAATTFIMIKLQQPSTIG